MMCMNAVFFESRPEKDGAAKHNPWGLQEDLGVGEKWRNLWSCCSCFANRRKVHSENSKRSTTKSSTATSATLSLKGDKIEREPSAETKLESSQNTPIMYRPPSHQPSQQLPPTSSGSETSGYFTPPAEHHLKDSALERFVPDPANSFEENNNVTSSFEAEEPNFQVVDSETSDGQEPAFTTRQSSASSAALSNEPSKDDNEDLRVEEVEADAAMAPYSPLHGIDFNENPLVFAEPRSKSKSEVNLIRSSLPDITERKNVNSAPNTKIQLQSPASPMSETVVAVVPYSFSESPRIQHMTLQQSPVRAVLPGYVDSNSNESSPAKHCDTTDEAPSSGLVLRRSISSRTSSLKRRTKSPSAVSDVRPYSRPKEALQRGLAQMESGDWESIIQGLNCLKRMARNHPEIVELHIHTVCVVLGRNIRNLRSQVARSACHAASEVFSTCRKGVDMELEELIPPLLQRTADTNRFLRSDANEALDAMTLNMPTSRVVSVIAAKGATHQNGVVRAASTRLFSDIAGRIGTEKVYQLPKETRDKLLVVGANGLTEGSLDTRKYSKSLMATLSRHPHFQKALVEAVPQHVVRHIAKAISSLSK